MRSPTAIGLGVVIAGGVLAACLLPLIAAEERTAIRLELVDERGRAIERATVAFETQAGTTLTVSELAWGRWVPADPLPMDPGWGRRVAAVTVLAFGCDRRAPVHVERQTHGARLGRLAPHPVPRTHVYELRAAVRCPAPEDATETGLALTRLVEELSAGEPWSYGAARELIRIGPAAAPALREIAAFFAEAESDSLRILLVRAIGAMGPAGRPAAALLFRLLEDPDRAMRRAGALALEQLGPGTPRLVTSLAAAARRDPDAYLQQDILRILGRMGPEARSAEGDLVAILDRQTEEESVRLAAFWALGKLETEGGADAQRRYAADHPILWSDPAPSRKRGPTRRSPSGPVGGPPGVRR